MDVSNQFSTFEKQTRQRKQHFIPAKFIKEKWLGLRGMDGDGKFIQEEDAKHVAKSDRLIKKYAEDAFADTRLVDGLHAIVDKDTTSEEKEWAKQQKTV